MAKSRLREPGKSGGASRHTAPLEPGPRVVPSLQTYGSAGAGHEGCSIATNIRLRWSRARGLSHRYKHSAPLEPGTRVVASLQTFGSAGAGHEGCRIATNIRLRWSRARGLSHRYKHSAPLE